MQSEPLGLIAGNGRFPFLVLEEAVRKGHSVIVVAIREETFPEIEQCVEFKKGNASLHWLGLGQLGKLLRIFKKEGVRQAIMAGQVRHVQIFAPGSRSARKLLSAMPDVRMMRLLFSLPRRDTSSLIGGVAEVLARQGIELLDSTILLPECLAQPGPLTRRGPSESERRDIEFGRPVALELARLDVGQTIVVKDRAVVAAEAMEGTDATIRRAAELVSGQSLTVVKVSRPRQDMRFDVPVVGLETVEVLKECNVSAMAIDAGRTLILDRAEFVRQANELGICIVAEE